MGGRHGAGNHLLPTGGLMAAIHGRDARPFRTVLTTSPLRHRGQRLITNMMLFVLISRDDMAGLFGSRDPVMGVGESRADIPGSQ